MDYLDNYLRVLPAYDRQEVERLIQENTELFEVKAVEKEEFEELIRRLSRTYEKVTTLRQTGDKLDAEHFNQLHGDVAMDLNYLYDAHLHLEKVIANYDRILRGTLDDIQREVLSLSKRVDELNLKAKGEDGLIVKGYGFEEGEKSLHMETDREQFAHLFTDRDGRILPQASLNRSFHNHFLSLPLKVTENAMQDENGMATAKIRTLYEPPGAKRTLNHLPKKAIDNSPETYWFQRVRTASPAHTQVFKKT